MFTQLAALESLEMVGSLRQSIVHLSITSAVYSACAPSFILVHYTHSLYTHSATCEPTHVCTLIQVLSASAVWKCLTLV